MVALTLELENARERYQTIFEETTDGILLIDPDRDSIHEANPQACEVLEYDHDELVTLSPADIFPDKDSQSDSFAEAVVQGWAEGYTCRTKSGRKIEVDISAAIVTLDGRSLLLASLRDVTERKRREQRLQVLTRIFRHNLRNDGNVIQGHADLLCDELAESELEDNVIQIRRTIDALLQLSSKVRRIQDVLERNRVTQSPISDLLTYNQEWFKDTYPAATLTISEPRREAFVGRRLSAAIQEAIDNAAKHTDDAVTISVSAKIDEGADQVRVDIEDNGPGIPEHELEVMRSGIETPQTHASGIGLWLIQWVIDSLGGEVTIQRSNPDGTLISLIVPIETAEKHPELRH
jgi:PAS domain S-box-containing protein